MRVEFRPARPADLKKLAGKLAAIDRRECAAWGREPRISLRHAYLGSTWCWAAVIDGEPEGLFGVVSADLSQGLGRPWLLGSDKLRRARKAFAGAAPTFVAAMRGSFPRLENWVHAEHEAAHRWLRRLGFTVEAATVWPGAGTQPMRRFFSGASDV